MLISKIGNPAGVPPPSASKSQSGPPSEMFCPPPETPSPLFVPPPLNPDPYACMFQIIFVLEIFLVISNTNLNKNIIVSFRHCHYLSKST